MWKSVLPVQYLITYPFLIYCYSEASLLFDRVKYTAYIILAYVLAYYYYIVLYQLYRSYTALIRTVAY